MVLISFQLFKLHVSTITLTASNRSPSNIIASTSHQLHFHQHHINFISINITSTSFPSSSHNFPVHQHVNTYIINQVCRGWNWIFCNPPHCPSNALGSSQGAVVSCGSEGTKNVSGLWHADGRHFVFLSTSGSTSLAGGMGFLQARVRRCPTGRERRLWRATGWASPSMCTSTTGFRGARAGWRRLSWQALDRRKIPGFIF